MPFERTIVLGVALLAVGCASDPMKVVDGGAWNRLKPRLPGAAPDIVEVHYIFLEREVGDSLLNQEIWAEADEHAIPLDQKAQLADNGLRVAKLGAHLSSEMLRLLEKGASTGGRRHQSHSGALAKLQTTESIENLQLFAILGGQPRGEEIKQAQGYLYVTPSVAEGDAVKVSVAPEIEFGERKNRRMPAADLSGWVIRADRDSRSFPELRVDLELASGEYMLIGCLPEKKGTIGWHFFTRTYDMHQFQTVVLIRAVRPSREELYTSGYDFDDFFLPDLNRDRGQGRSLVREAVLAAQQPLR